MITPFVHSVRENEMKIEVIEDFIEQKNLRTNAQ